MHKDRNQRCCRSQTSRHVHLLVSSCSRFYSKYSVMPPKKPAADTADPPASDAPVEEKKSNAAALRKLATHPSTAVMVKEALKALDSRKGVSSQAIQTYIGQKYPSVDLVRLKHLVRRALKKGIETGTLVRPANSNVTTGATGKFRLAPNTKEAKTKTENVDPNVLKEAKDEAKKLKKAGAAKKRDADNEVDQSKPNLLKSQRRRRKLLPQTQPLQRLLQLKSQKPKKKLCRRRERTVKELLKHQRAPKQEGRLGAKLLKQAPTHPLLKQLGDEGRRLLNESTLNLCFILFCNKS
ncbi:h1-8 [Pungitius sinensis]